MGRRFGQVLEQERARIIGAKRLLTGQIFVEHDAEGVQIGAGVERLAAQLFGGHVGQCARHRTRLVFGHIPEQPRQSEVHQFKRAIGADKNIFRFDVTVQNAPAMRGFEGAA